MDNSSFWWQAAGVDPGPDPGGGINNSLRFREGISPQVVRQVVTATSGPVTVSWWMKLGTVPASASNLMIFRGDNEAISSSFRYMKATQEFQLYSSNSSESANTTAVYRDPSAWYHVVISSNGVDNTKVWINNQRQIETLLGFKLHGYMGFGSPDQDGTPGNPNYCWGGYLAGAVYAIDGQALEPTAFGRYNTAGVWVPVDYSGSFGSNGFHLDFADPSNIGKDISGNGNDFTATGFETANTSSPNYDVMQDSPTQNYSTGNPLQVNDYTNATLTKANLEWADQAVAQRSTTFSLGNGQWYWEYTHQGASITEMYPMCVIQGIGQVYTNALSLGPKKYFDPSQPTTDYEPHTSELKPGGTRWCTYDSSTGTLTMGNTDGDTWSHVWNAGAPGGMYADSDGTVTPAITFNINSGSGGITANFGQQPFIYTPPDGFKALQTQNLPAATIADGRDHFQAITGPGQGADGTPVAGQRAGNWSSGLTSSTGAFQDTRPASLAFNGSTADFAQVSTGGLGFTLTWAPSTDIEFGTLEVFVVTPNATISFNGGTEVTSNRGRIEVATNGTLSSTAPLVITSTAAGTAPNLAAVFVDGDVLVDFGILPLAQQTFPNGLWWIKDRVNATGHRLVDSVNGTTAALVQPDSTNYMPYVEQAYTAPTGNCVAWCWNAANTDGGFSITNGTHGLGTTPAFVIDRALNVWHQSLPAGQGIVLSSNAPAAAQTWTVNDTTVTGPGGGTYYSWAEIPNYSSFGSYQGNGNDDGVFVFTNFRPAFLVVKRTDPPNGHWMIIDTTRSPFNQANNRLHADLGQPESANVGPDILSNGFKMRNGTSIGNMSGGSYIYCAFAENPFQAPATAR